MPRKERIIEPGFYHVISRGGERRNVFLDRDDFDMFLSLMSNEFASYNIIIHASCLMTNHYHLLMETKEPNISDAMKRLNSLYSIYFNKNISVQVIFGKEDLLLIIFMMIFISGM